MFRPQPKQESAGRPTRTKLEPLSKTPTLDDIKVIFAEAEKTRGRLVEVAVRREKPPVYILTCQFDAGAAEPLWSLYEGDDGSKVCWTYPNANLDMIAEIIFMSMPLVSQTIIGDKTTGAIPTESARQAQQATGQQPQQPQQPAQRPGPPAPPPSPYGAPPPNPYGGGGYPNQPGPNPNQPYQQPGPQPGAYPNAPYPQSAPPSPPGYPGPQAQPNMPYPGPQQQGYPVPPGQNPQFPQGYPANPNSPYGAPAPAQYPPQPNSGYPGQPQQWGPQQTPPPSPYQTPGTQPSGYPQPQPPSFHPGQTTPASTGGDDLQPIDLGGFIDVLQKGQPNLLLGHLFVEAGMLPEPCLEAALKVQELVRKGDLSEAGAVEALRRAAERGGALDENTINQCRSMFPAGAEKPPQAASSGQAVDPREAARETILMIQSAGIVSENDISTAEAVRRKHGGDVGSILIAAGKIERSTMEAARACYPLARDCRLNIEEVTRILGHCQRTKSSLEDACRELQIRPI